MCQFYDEVFTVDDLKKVIMFYDENISFFILTNIKYFDSLRLCGCTEKPKGRRKC